ncbi:MAG: glutamate-5-semialdehyde dehydrogenase [Pseudomonadota bacterium]
MRHIDGMNAPISLSEAELAALMREIGTRARTASSDLSTSDAEARTAALRAMASGLRDASSIILDANAMDMVGAREKGLSPAMLDRLELTPERINAMADGIVAIAELNDPIGDEIARWTVPSGLDIARVRTPLGVIGIIYESRPNVTADAGALCLRTANACILRGGSESSYSSGAIVDVLRGALRNNGLPEDAIQRVPTTDRAAVGEMLSGLAGTIDVIIPRGGKTLTSRAQRDARVPVIGHLEGLVNMYVDGTINVEKASEIILNAKLRRTGICGALETLLVDKKALSSHLPAIADALTAAGCELRGDDEARRTVPDMAEASVDDWSTEYLAPILAVRTVNGLEGALTHIAEYGSGHTEAILTEDQATADIFCKRVDASIVLHNASTQFADGGEFGMGAEIGIATGRVHARGPVGAEQLTIFKYVVRGTGQIRH